VIKPKVMENTAFGRSRAEWTRVDRVLSHHVSRLSLSWESAQFSRKFMIEGGFASGAWPASPGNARLATTAVGIEDRGHQPAAVLPEVEDWAVVGADRKAVGPRAHHL